jgi:hypothetical protein
MVCSRARKQQVPHRAFSPVRNDILFIFISSLSNQAEGRFFYLRFFYCAIVGFAQAACDRCCGNFNSPVPKILSFRGALKAREEPAVLWSGNGLWSSKETAGSSPGVQPGSE